MAHWLRFEIQGRECFGTLADGTITEWEGDMFAAPEQTARRFPLASVRLLMPCRPGKMVCLWNNFHERAQKEGLQRLTRATDWTVHLHRTDRSPQTVLLSLYLAMADLRRLNAA